MSNLCLFTPLPQRRPKTKLCSMGSEDGGNMFPGVTYPFGVVKLGIVRIPQRAATRY